MQTLVLCCWCGKCVASKQSKYRIFLPITNYNFPQSFHPYRLKTPFFSSVFSALFGFFTNILLVLRQGSFSRDTVTFTGVSSFHHFLRPLLLYNTVVVVVVFIILSPLQQTITFVYYLEIIMQAIAVLCNNDACVK